MRNIYIAIKLLFSLGQSLSWDVFEASAKSGYMVHETLAAVAAKLHVKERALAEH